MEYAIALVILVAVVGYVVTRPLRKPGELQRREESQRAEFEAAKEAKYREIRDAELDYRMGKLSEADWKTTDRELRDEAIEILRRLDAVSGRSPGEPLT
jgi:hypothetical protein